MCSNALARSCSTSNTGRWPSATPVGLLSGGDWTVWPQPLQASPVPCTDHAASSCTRLHPWDCLSAPKVAHCSCCAAACPHRAGDLPVFCRADMTITSREAVKSQPAFMWIWMPSCVPGFVSSAGPHQRCPAPYSAGLPLAPRNPPSADTLPVPAAVCSHLGPTSDARPRTGLACRLLPAWLPPSNPLLGPMAVMSRALRAPLPVELGRWRPCEAERCGGEARG